MNKTTSISKIEFGKKVFQNPQKRSMQFVRKDSPDLITITITSSCGNEENHLFLINTERQKKRALYRKLNRMTGII